MTQAGMILGTAAYMSPEQAKGRAVDRRADVWAFACVIYEMLTGRRAFAGDDVAEVLAAVIKSEPDWSLLPADVSPALRMHLQRALAKDPRTRVQSAGDLRLAIEGAFDDPSAMPVQPGARATPTSALRRLAWAAAGLFAGIAVTVGALTLQSDPPAVASRDSTSPRRRDSIILLIVVQATSRSCPTARPSCSAAGSAISGLSIAVRRLDQLQSARLTQGFGESPFMSPDGNWVGFFSNAKLQKAPVQGGSAINICDLPGSLRGATWTEGDTIIFGHANATGLWQVPAGGGKPVQITKSERGASHIFPEALPGNKAVLFTMWAGSNDGASIGVLDVATRTTRVLVQSGTNPKFVKTGHIVYVDRGALRAVAFDVDRVAVMSEPVTLLDGVLTKPTGASNFAVADDGTLAYVAGGFRAVTIRWYGSTARDTEEPVPGLSRQNYQIVRVSPKGTHLVTDFGQPRDVWSSRHHTRDGRSSDYRPERRSVPHLVSGRRAHRVHIEPERPSGDLFPALGRKRHGGEGVRAARVPGTHSGGGMVKRRPHTDPHRRFRGLGGLDDVQHSARRRPAIYLSTASEQIHRRRGGPIS